MYYLSIGLLSIIYGNINDCIFRVSAVVPVGMVHVRMIVFVIHMKMHSTHKVSVQH